MTKKEQQEHARLRALWATQKATRQQMLRCMELDRKAETEHHAAPRTAQ